MDDDEGGAATILTGDDGMTKHRIEFDAWDRKYTFKLLGIPGVECWLILEGDQRQFVPTKPDPTLSPWQAFLRALKGPGKKSYAEKWKNRLKRPETWAASDSEIHEAGPGWRGVVLAAIASYLVIALLRNRRSTQ